MNWSLTALCATCLTVFSVAGCSTSSQTSDAIKAEQDVAASPTPNCTPPFFEAQAQGCNLAGVHFTDSRVLLGTFANANLQGANFSGVSLVNVDFSGANLTGANFSGAIIGQGS